MGTTTDRARVGHHLLAEALTMMVLGSRDSLPHERNGRPVAPSSPRAAQLRKDLGQHRTNPFGTLVEISVCDIVDGVSPLIVGAPYRQLLAHLEVIARRTQRSITRPLSTLFLTETRAQGRADVAQHIMLQRPECPDAIEATLRSAREHRAAMDDVIQECERKLAAAHAAPPVSSTRRGAMAVMS